MARDGRPVMAAVDDEVVALRLAVDRLADRRFEHFVAFGLAQRRAPSRCILLADAHEKGAGAGQSHAVAALAETVGHRRDEAEPSAGSSYGAVARGPAGA